MDLGLGIPECKCNGPRGCSLSRGDCGRFGKGSGLGEVLALVISGVGQGKESSEEWSELWERVLWVVYGVCAAWSDRLVGIRVWG